MPFLEKGKRRRKAKKTTLSGNSCHLSRRQCQLLRRQLYMLLLDQRPNAFIRYSGKPRDAAVVAAPTRKLCLNREVYVTMVYRPRWPLTSLTISSWMNISFTKYIQNSLQKLIKLQNLII